MRIFNRKLAIVLIMLFSVSAPFVWVNRYAFVKLYYMRDFFRLSPAKAIKIHEVRIAEDRDVLNRYELFFPSRGTTDAGPFLNPRIHWQIGDIHHRGDLVLPEFIHKELALDWVKKRPRFGKMGMKFEWFRELRNFDVWSPELESPAYPPGRRHDTFAFPVPTYRDLLSWAKLRYLYGKESGDVRGALADVRHLARLIWTNDTMVAAHVVLKLLKLENEFEGILTPKEFGDWAFVPEEHLMRAKRYFSSSPGLVDIRLPDEVFDRNIKTNVGVCLFLNEAMPHYLMNRDFLGEELRYGMARFARAVAAANCRRSALHRMWADENWKTHYTLAGVTVLGRPVTFDAVEANPDLKAVVGYLLGTNPQLTLLRY
jgi:hypothetical protein